MEKANPEKDLAQTLLSLISKNKLSVEEGKKLITQARATGLEVKGPWQNQPGSSKDPPKKRKLEAVPEEGCKEPEEGCNGNASRSWRRWLKKQNHWAPLHWLRSPCGTKRTIKKSKWHCLSCSHMIGLYLGQPGAFEEGLPEEGTWLAREWREANEGIG